MPLFFFLFRINFHDYPRPPHASKTTFSSVVFLIYFYNPVILFGSWTYC